jgi:hypothetical protein
LVERVLAVDGVRDDFEVRLGFKDQAEARTDERLVVGDEDADYDASPPSGRWAQTA